MNTYRFEIEGTFESLLHIEELESRLVIALAAEDSGNSLVKLENDSVGFEKLNLVLICPHDGLPLEHRMFDIDGTNLEEHAVGLECRYGAPALR